MSFYQVFGRALLCTGIIACLTGSCKQGEKTSSMTQEIPSDLKIIFGQQGTFAGRSMGYSINGTGEVIRWEGKYPEEHTEATATVSEDEIQRLWRHAQKIGFLEMKEQAMSTVNMFITVTADGESRRVTWVGRDEDALTPAQKFYDECLAVAKAALEQEERD